MFFYLAGKQVNNFERVLNDSNGHKLLAVVATVHHERTGETLDDGTQRLVKSFDLITASRVRYVLGCLAFDWYVILFNSNNYIINNKSMVVSHNIKINLN